MNGSSGTEPLDPPPSTEAVPVVPGRRRPRVVVGCAVSLLVATAVGGGLLLHRHGDRRSSAPSGPTDAFVTTTVARGDISTGISLPGTLGFGATTAVTATGAGVVTWLPHPGTVVRRGGQLARVDDEPTTLFYGSIPLYRTLGTENTVGRDVRVLVDNLRALGYDVGTQPEVGTTVIRTTSATPSAPVGETSADDPSTPSSPGPGTTASEGPPAATVVRQVVHEGEGVMTAMVIRAVKAWQSDLGLAASGEVPQGSVAVLPDAVRVNSLSTQVGSPASGNLLSVSSTTKSVTVTADQTQAASVNRGDLATVTLSDGTETTARVTSIGTALAVPDGASDAAPQLTISLALAHPKRLRGVDAADLNVSLVRETHRDVLTVSVKALLALRGGGYALQLPSGTLLPVTTGIFGQGIVEVSGPGVTDTLKVVTTS